MTVLQVALATAGEEDKTDLKIAMQTSELKSESIIIVPDANGSVQDLSKEIEANLQLQEDIQK